MRIAVTYQDGQIFQHFGHTERFKIYDCEDGAVTLATTVHMDGTGHGALAGALKNMQVDTLICGGIGGGARQALAEAGITLYPGASGSADEAVRALLEGRLQYDPDTTCSHHDHHGEGHGDCQGHSCGGTCR